MGTVSWTQPTCFSRATGEGRGFVITFTAEGGPCPRFWQSMRLSMPQHALTLTLWSSVEKEELSPGADSA